MESNNITALKDNPWKTGKGKKEAQLSLQRSGFIPKTVSTTGGHDIVSSHMKSHYNRITGAKCHSRKGTSTFDSTGSVYAGLPQSARSMKGRSLLNSRPMSARTAPETSTKDVNKSTTKEQGSNYKRKVSQKKSKSAIAVDVNSTNIADTPVMSNYNDHPTPDMNEQDEADDGPSKEKLAEYLILKYGVKSSKKAKQQERKGQQSQLFSNSVQKVPSRITHEVKDDPNRITSTRLGNYDFQGSSVRDPNNLRSNVDNWLNDANASVMAEVNLEMEYLKFMSSLTTDVISRGIFSDRYINRIIEQHIRDNRATLNEDHMRELTEQLKRDLCIRD
ncbi:uncharacterized protein TRIADDRAFT_57176 [Trichoplax adhaerens]|uniref:Uncharacterized protein n=1 Tax=Trichoplax adhaerens TaxID=10228 RepID=B3S0U8_TRIAD|nr:predicted protein [Trichoplax adhaerens]EDV23708.1 predicted protein [Trichoplax adhaerens]|eukprot:XP_002113234.1 predicted protein [Trichoplax adhaerens]